MVNVYIDMCGDLFHYGHVNLLKEAKSLGDFLIVGVHSDETIKSYKRTPVMIMNERIKVIESCKYVDKVIPNAPLVINEEYIKGYNIDILEHEHNILEHDKYIFMYDIPYKLGIFRRLDYTNSISTTDIINRIKSRSDI